MAKFYDDDRNKVKTTHFGSEMSNYTQHKNNERKELYISRHKSNENWNDYTTAGCFVKMAAME